MRILTGQRRPRPRRIRRLALLLPVALTATMVATVGGPVSSAVAANSPLGAFDCIGYNGLDNRRMLQADGERELVPLIFNDQMTLPGQSPIKVGNGRGDITWAKPAIGISNETWLNTLEWLGALLTSERDYSLSGSRWRERTPAEMSQQYARAAAVTQDWIADNAGWQRVDPRGPRRALTNATAHRLAFLLCLREKVGGQAWLDAAITEHAGFLVGDPRAGHDYQRYVLPSWKPAASWPRWMGTNNVGLDQSVAVLGAACRLGRSDWATVALRRIDADAATSFDSDGVNNEQAPGYAAHGYGQWVTTLGRVKQCLGQSIPLLARLTKALDFLTLAYRPDGTLEALGDTNPVADNLPGTTLAYGATLGASGPAPTVLSGIFDGRNGGYAFGHSTWGTDQASFREQTFYSLRWGPKRLVHGHNDHMSLTYWARGHQILADPGHVGYEDTPYRWWLRTPEAHSVVTATDAAAGPFNAAIATPLIASSSTPTGDSFVLKDVGAYAGVARQRSVLLVDDAGEPDAMVVLDKINSAVSHSYTQLWHLGPEWTTAVQGHEVLATSGDTAVHVIGVPLGKAALAPSIVKGSTSPIQGWVSPGLNQKVAAPTVVFPLRGSDVVALTVIVPAALDVPVSATATAEGAGWRIDIVVGDRTVTAHADAAMTLHR